MNRQKIIVLAKLDLKVEGFDKKDNPVFSPFIKEIETWGSLTECCKAHKFPYHTLKSYVYPFQYGDWHFEKVSFRALSNER